MKTQILDIWKAGSFLPTLDPTNYVQDVSGATIALRAETVQNEALCTNQVNGHELGQTPGDGEGQGSLVSCSPWDHVESDRTWWLNNNSNQPSLHPGNRNSSTHSWVPKWLQQLHSASVIIGEMGRQIPGASCSATLAEFSPKFTHWLIISLLNYKSSWGGIPDIVHFDHHLDLQIWTYHILDTQCISWLKNYTQSLLAQSHNTSIIFTVSVGQEFQSSSSDASGSGSGSTSTLRLQQILTRASGISRLF